MYQNVLMLNFYVLHTDVMNSFSPGRTKKDKMCHLSERGERAEEEGNKVREEVERGVVGDGQHGEDVDGSGGVLRTGRGDGGRGDISAAEEGGGRGDMTASTASSGARVPTIGGAACGVEVGGGGGDEIETVAVVGSGPRGRVSTVCVCVCLRERR